MPEAVSVGLGVERVGMGMGIWEGGRLWSRPGKYHGRPPSGSTYLYHVHIKVCTEHVSGLHVTNRDVHLVRAGALVLLIASGAPVPGT